MRDLRELTRYRAVLVSELTVLSNRIQKEAESGNIKLGQVALRAMGVSGREMLMRLSEGVTDVETLSDLARGRLREKKEALREALEVSISGPLGPRFLTIIGAATEGDTEADGGRG
jgi:hypothetical protein